MAQGNFSEAKGLTRRPLAGYPPQPASTAYPAGPYVAPPPVGYPMKHGHDYPQNPAAGETKAKGDGFLKGWYA
uniref:Uncharacterized protein n=1 Tax=Vitis vinifera TaxID=29760 RepID=A5AZA5_VITVI|nr:hypothetical protein VITISV_022822 [Vitis vinifera]